MLILGLKLRLILGLDICTTNCADGNDNKTLSYTQCGAEVQHFYHCIYVTKMSQSCRETVAEEREISWGPYQADGLVYHF
jgi:hypothetical protein